MMQILTRDNTSPTIEFLQLSKISVLINGRLLYSLQM